MQTLKRRDFLKVMVAGAVTIALPLKVLQNLYLTPPVQSGATWCDLCKCFHHGPKYSEEEYMELVVRESAQRLADTVDEAISEWIIAGGFNGI